MLGGTNEMTSKNVVEDRINYMYGDIAFVMDQTPHQLIIHLKMVSLLVKHS